MSFKLGTDFSLNINGIVCAKLYVNSTLDSYFNEKQFGIVYCKLFMCTFV